MRDIYLEGTDGVGKTTILEELKKEGIVCHDRHRDVISRYMLFDISMEVRARKYAELLQRQNLLVLFLINRDREELERRILRRHRAGDKFDSKAYEYNQLYLETFEYMKTHYDTGNSLIMVDLTGQTISESVRAVRDVIENSLPN